MRTYKLTIAYDGSRFRGWQRQPDTELTIQGILEKQISELAGYPVEVNGSGRTDGGVHARGQTASIILAGKVVEDDFLVRLNESLPEDIRVLKMELAKNGFHARHSARGKCYEYTVDISEKADVFTRKYTFHYPHCLNIEKMKKAAEYLIGSHDFAGFTDRPDETTSVRWIDTIEIRSAGDCGAGEKAAQVQMYNAGEAGTSPPGKICIRYQGSGFMYHMVRILTGTLLEVGIGERTPESIPSVLESRKRTDAGFLAPASGLCLMKVNYK